MKFWDVIKEVSAQPIRQEAERLFVLALAGEPGAVAVAHAAVLGAGVTPEQTARAAPFFFSASPPYSAADENRLRYADLLVSLPGGPGITDLRPADTLLVEQPEHVLELVLAHRPDLRVPLARRFPGFRTPAAEQVIRDTSRINAEFAAIAGLSQSIPFLAPLFPVVAGTDIMVLTKNQVMMIFRLAAIYGEDMGLKARAREIAPVIGGALGWRTLARQLAGAIPGALGLPLRAGIAFSGTYAVGRAAQMAFDVGRRPTRREMARIYEEGTQLARDTVGRLRARFAKPGEPSGEQKALPAPSVEPLPMPESETEALAAGPAGRAEDRDGA
ncbi:MAG TPA: hypothetical protein VK689_14860 [Armatimonadota bacterium]|nr:hypothetical protein [Armatimonadota bacterium]